MSDPAWDRVLQQAANFMKRESFLWIENRKLNERAVKAEQEVLRLKNLLELKEEM